MMSYTDWEKLTADCRQCRRCGLCETRHNVVVGVGPSNAEVLFIGEGPGENEDLQGEPFVGRGGKLLDLALHAVGLDRHHNIYIANTVKCRPPKNRDPLPAEEVMCIGYLRDQVLAIRPKVIVCLGRISAMRIIKPDFKITAEHGKWFDKNGYSVCAVYHPAALLRDPRKKDEMLADMMAIKERIDSEEA